MVVNLLDHLAPFAAVDTDEVVVEARVVPKEKIPEEPGSTICGLHPGEKCDFYCDDCRDPLCADCIVSLSEGPHKTHKIRKLRDVLTTYSTQHKDVLQLVTNMKIEGKQRTEELLEELVLSRDSLMKEAKSKRDKAHQEADRWYQNTTATISKVYDQLHAQILQFISKSDLQELQQSLQKFDLQKIDEDFKQAQRFLDQLQSSVTSFKKSTVWPTKFWSVDVGKITDDFTVDLGSVTEPTLKLPDVNRFPYTIEKMHENTEVTKRNVEKQTVKHQGFRINSDHFNLPKESEDESEESEDERQRREQEERREKDRKKEREERKRNKAPATVDEELASRLATHGSYQARDSGTVLHLCEVDASRTNSIDGIMQAYADTVRTIRPAAVVWYGANPPSVPGVEELRVDDGDWGARVRGLQDAESRGHKTVAVNAAWSVSSIKPLSDHITARRDPAATHVWLLSGRRDLSRWQQQMDGDSRYRRIN